MPECAAPLTPGPPGVRCSSCGREYDASRGHRSAARAAFAEQTWHLDEALHADARHDRSRRPCSVHASASGCCSGFELVPGDRALDLGQAAAARSSGRRERRGHDGRRYQSVFRARRSTAATSCSAICDDALRDGAFDKAWSLDVFEHVSTQAPRDVLARRTVLAPNGALFAHALTRTGGLPAASAS